MSEETIQILNLKVQGAESVADLRNNVTELKKALKEAEEQSNTPEGWAKYQETLEVLKQNQNALKDAMYATSGSLEDVKKSALGASTSYNSLVNKMAGLKREFRSTSDEVRRGALGTQIREINDELKKMDALQGNFQRNVGNYRSVLSGLGDGLDAFRKGLGAATGGLKGMKDGVEALQKSPAIATFTILVSLVMKLADAVKDDEKATAALKKGMEALQPVMDFLSGILDKIVDLLVDVIGKVTEFLGSSGILNKIIKGVMGVGNAVLQFIIAPFKGIVAAIKVFKEQGVKGIGDAARAFKEEAKSGIAFKENFQTGQTVADTILSGVSSRKKKAKETGKQVGKEIGNGLIEGLNEILDKIDKDWLKRLDDRQKLHEKRQKEIADYNKEQAKKFEQEQEAEAEAVADAWLESYHKQEEEAKKLAEAKKALLKGVASSTSDILGSIADLYEKDEEGAKKNAEKIKALRIAAATIDTISGAIGAFMQASATYPPPYGQILGAIEAAAITAAGVAQIAQMKATSVTDGNARPTSISAKASAPTLQPNVTNVRSVTSASEEDRLNQMAKEQRVYILASDIQASQDQIKTQVSESSF